MQQYGWLKTINSYGLLPLGMSNHSSLRELSTTIRFPALGAENENVVYSYSSEHEDVIIHFNLQS